MKPVTFDSCFGTYYPGWSRKGVIVCSSFGLENVRYQPALAELAEALCGRGLNVLLFDYHGTGNSAGTSLDPGILHRWTGNVKAAGKWLRQQGNIDTISIAGLRLGAIVATLASSTCDDVEELILLAPPASGESFIAELRHADAAPEETRDMSLPFEGVDLGGHRLGGQTIREIGGFRWQDIHGSSAGRVVVFAENRSADRDSLADAFSTIGCPVELHDGLDGFERSLSDYRASRRKPPSWGAIADLLTVPPVSGGLWPRPAPVIPMTGPGYIEIPVFSGAEQVFSGLFCRSSYGEESREAVIFLPGTDGYELFWPRLPVELSRRLARTGIASLRLNTLGDRDCDDLGPISPARQLVNAVDWIKAHRYSDVTIVAAADVARDILDRAACDSRIDRTVLFDRPAMPLGLSATTTSMRAEDTCDAMDAGFSGDSAIGARMAVTRSTLAALSRLKDFAEDQSMQDEPLRQRLEAFLANGKPVNIIKLAGIDPSVALNAFLASGARSSGNPIFRTLDCTESRLAADERREAFGDCLLCCIQEAREVRDTTFRLALQAV